MGKTEVSHCIIRKENKMNDPNKEKREREDREEKERRRKRSQEDEESSRRMFNMSMGDMLNTGILGGIDFDITTPW